MKKTFRMRRVLTLSLASMMMLGGFQAAPFGGVKVVKAQQADVRLQAIKTDFENFLNNNNPSYTIESPNEGEDISGRVKITINNPSNYKDNGKIEYIWLSLEEDDAITYDSNSNEDQKRKEYFESSSDGRKKTAWSPNDSGLSIEFSDEDVAEGRTLIYLKHEKIDKNFFRGFFMEETPKQGKKDDTEGNFWIEDTVEGANIYARVNNTLEIKKAGTQAWLPVNTQINLLDGVNAGESAIWKVRTKTTGKKLPSLPVEITVKKKEALTLEHLKALTFTLEGSDGLNVSGFGDVFKDYRIGNIKYKVGGSEAVEISSRSDDLTISNVVNQTVKFYVGDSDNNSFVININKEAKPDEQTVKKKDEKTITFGANFANLKYKKVGENEYKTPDKAEVTNLVSGTYEVIKAGSDTKTHQFNTQIVGESHTFTLDSEPLTIKLEAPFLPPYLYFPELEDLSASEEKKTEEKKEEEKKETEKKTEDKASEDKKENEKKAETSIEKDETKDKTPVEPIGSVEKSFKNDKKQNITAKASFVEEVLKAEKGNLNLAVKGASVKLSEKVLSSVFGGEANEVSLALKTSKVKTAPKALKNRTMISKTSYDVKLMVGKEDISDYDLQGAKFQVKLSVTLKKAPKKLYVLNVDTNRLIKASYKNGKISFKTDEAGKFVIVK